MKRIEELDGLRCFAILAVLLAHFGQAYISRFNFLALGWCGVDLFFAISGFLITKILIQLRGCGTGLAYKTFYWRRAIRIFPAYYAALVAILLLAFLHGETITRNEMIAAWVFVSSLVRGYSVPLILQRIFGHASFHTIPQALIHYHFDQFRYAIGIFWSLSAEELFYILWAPVILLGSRRVVACLSVGPILFCPLLRAFTHTSGYSEAFSFPCRLDSLAIGGCMALLFHAAESGYVLRRYLDRALIIVTPISFIAVAFLVWRCGAFRGVEVRSTLAFSIFGYTLLAIFCSSLVGTCVRWNGSRWMTVLRRSPITYVGLVSYMVYLIHIPVYVALGLLWPRVIAYSLAHGLLAILCSVTIAGLSWKYFESPILRFRNPPSFFRRSFSVTAESAAGD